MDRRQELQQKIDAVVRGEVTLAELQGMTYEHARVIAQMGCDFAAAGRLDEAQIIFKGLIASNPKDSTAHAALGTVLQKLDQTEQARAAYDRALEWDPRNAIALGNRGELRLKAGDRDGLADLRRAVEVDPETRTYAARRAQHLLNAVLLSADAIGA